MGDLGELKLYVVNKAKIGPPTKTSGFSSGFFWSCKLGKIQQMVSNLGVPFRTIGLVGRPRSSKIKLYLVNKAKIGPPTKSSGFSSGFLVMQ